MRPVKKLLCLATLLLFSVLQLPALEVVRNDLKLVLHEGVGRFSLYSRGGAETYTPLFVAQDPRTSVMSVIVGDRLYKLGESREFKETLQSTAGGGCFCWVSKELRISEDFVMLDGGVAVRITLTNMSERALTVGLRFCLDTYLGEKGADHFSTSDHARVNRELEVLKSDMVRYWKSASSGKEGGISLVSHTSGKNVTEPDRIIFANWKRINDTSWKFEISPSRNFNLMPYSINDSAVCQYYSPRQLAPQEVWSIDLFFSTGEDAVGPAAAAETGQPRSASPAAPASRTDAGAEPRVSAAQAPVSGTYKDLLAVNSLIEEINRLMLQGTVAEEELERLRGILTALKSKFSAYSGSD